MTKVKLIYKQGEDPAGTIIEVEPWKAKVMIDSLLAEEADVHTRAIDRTATANAEDNQRDVRVTDKDAPKAAARRSETAYGSDKEVREDEPDDMPSDEPAVNDDSSGEKNDAKE